MITCAVYSEERRCNYAGVAARILKGAAIVSPLETGNVDPTRTYETSAFVVADKRGLQETWGRQINYSYPDVTLA